ncbi:MAG: response regulator [Chloroflexi bacterium]|nr:response regulator [Chloroflexota bacterium]
MDPVVIAAEALFGAVFVAAVVQYLRRPDGLRLWVALVFLPLALIFALQIARSLSLPVPAAASVAAGVLLFAQPVFTLGLVSQVRPIPRFLIPGSIVVLVGSIGVALLPMLAGGQADRTFVVVAAVAFGVIELIAAGYLAADARRRRGPIRVRMWFGAGATALLGLALLVAVGGVGDGQIGAFAQVVSRISALLAAAGYVVAFMPPLPLRRAFQATATIGFLRRLVSRSEDSVEAIWADYADVARGVSGCATVVIQALDGESAVIMAVSGLEDGSAFVGRRMPRARLEGVLGGAGPAGEQDAAQVGGLAEELAQVAGARFVSVVRLDDGASDQPTAAILLSVGRSLFHASALDLLAVLGDQSAVIAERRAVFAAQEALTSQLAQTVEALRIASQAKSDFLASMSHELRTPLSAILGFSDLMREEPRDGDSVRVPVGWIEHVHRGGEHLLALINDVLDLAKVEAGRLDLQFEPIDLPSAVAESVNGLRPLAERKSLTIEALVEPITLVADRGRLRQVLYNLLSNAIKFTPPDGRVTVAGAVADGRLHLGVTDTGVGIAAEDLGAVFDEFRQVGDFAERQEGTGLGLALSRRLVEAHGGRIELESTVGSGSTFTIVMPLSPTTPVTERTRDAAPPPVAAAASSGRPAVLVIEDDASAVRLLREYLAPVGYDVRIATDGEAGLAAARAEKPAAVLLDILLPGIDGWEVLRRMRNDPVLRDVPVVILTVVDERDVGLALGAVDYLVKPVSRDALLACLARHVAPPSGDHRVKVLAVDDDPTALALILGALEPEGFEVVLSDGGRDALERTADVMPDVVVCDLIMPDVDGFDVVAGLKRDPRTADVPILVYTAKELTPDDKVRLNGQIAGILVKGPDGKAALLAWLSRAAAQA